MKPTYNQNNTFSMDDFEEGLMLAGYIMPNSISELNEREQLEQYEKESEKKQPKNIYFKRVVLAAEIVSKLHNEPSLGRIKFQKLVYLCEHAAEMNLADRYQKQVAGPFDNKFMHSIEKEFKKNRWFLVEKKVDNNITRSKYIPLENLDNYKHYYDNYFKKEDAKIQFIIELFRTKKTDYTELATTVFACFRELSAKKEIVRKEELLNLFYSWSEKKKRFTEKEVLESLIWLHKNGLIVHSFI